MENSGIRIDKWLWAVRLFKTRSQATEACRNGKVKINEKPVKASKEIKENEIISIQQHQITKTVKVLQLLDKRVSAKSVSMYLEDLTPAAEYENIEKIKPVTFIYRPKGKGRPTKKERRQIEKFKF